MKLTKTLNRDIEKFKKRIVKKYLLLISETIK